MTATNTDIAMMEPVIASQDGPVLSALSLVARTTAWARAGVITVFVAARPDSLVLIARRENVRITARAEANVCPTSSASVILDSLVSIALWKTVLSAAQITECAVTESATAIRDSMGVRVSC